MDAMATSTTKKKLVRRVGRDRSQAVRRSVQLAFLALNAWIGCQFYGFVRYCETQGATPRFTRPPGVEGFLPIASLMNLKILLVTGKLPTTLCAGMLLLIAFLVISLLLRKAFCGWLCPIGTLSEALWKLGRKVIGRNLSLPHWLDLPLRGLKYLLMGFFLLAVITMSAGAIEAFLNGPYGAVADVQMLNFFRFMSGTAGAILLLLAGLSLFFQNFWCRYLCPYGALMGLAALVSPVRIERAQEPCVDCGKCSEACPALLPVDHLVSIRSAECMSCLECVAVCPAEEALSMKLYKRRTVTPLAFATALAVLFLSTVVYGRLTGHWTSRIPVDRYMELVRTADQTVHP